MVKKGGTQAKGVGRLLQVNYFIKRWRRTRAKRYGTEGWGYGCLRFGGQSQNYLGYDI